MNSGKLRVKFPGSYTVEMSLIMPLVLGVTVLVIYAAMYSHDLVVRDYNIIKAINDECKDNISQVYEGSIRKRIEDNVSDKTAAKWYDEIEVDIESDNKKESINIDVKGSMSYSQNYIANLTNGKVFGIRNRICHMNVHEPDWIINKRQQ